MGRQKIIGIENNIITIKNEIQTDIFNGGTSEFFINMNPKDIPPKGHPDRKAFVKGERIKCVEGINIGGVYIPGNLYFHLNYFKSVIDVGVDKSGKTLTSNENPTFRDTEWIIHTEYAQAMREQKGYCLASCRQLAKSSVLVSLTLREVSLIKKAEALIVFAGDEDKQTFTKKMQDAIGAGEDFIIVPNIDKDWSSKLIRFGITNKDNSVDERAKLFLYNSVNGTKTEVGAGKSLTFFAMDEIGKYPFRGVWEAVEPALKGDYGYRSAPFFVWTGGDTEKANAAFNFTLNPESSKLLSFKTEGKDTARILFADYRKECKVEIPFTQFLDNNNIPHEDNNAFLNFMKIKVSDVQAARELTMKELEAKKKDKDPTAWIKYKSYYPLTIADILTRVNRSNFKSEYIQQQREYIKANVTIDTVDLYRDLATKEVKHRLVDKPLIHDWKNPSYALDAPVAVYDFPKYKGYGVHVIGCLTPDEKVLTQEGLKNVQDVRLEDNLINENGDLVEIKNLQKYLVKNEDVYELKIGNTYRTTKFTKEHPILVSKEKIKYVSKGKRKREGLNQRYKEFDFNYKPVANIEVGDWIKVPNTYKKEINNFEHLWNEIECPHCSKLENPLNKKDFWWLVGLFLGDGWCDKQRVSFAFNKKETYYIEKFKFVIKELFNKENISITEKEGSIELYIFSVQLKEFLSEHFGKYAKGKKIPEWVKYLPHEFKNELLRGYLNSDGYVGLNKTFNTLVTEFVSINLEMLESFQDILFSLGITSSLKLLRSEKIHKFKERESKTQSCYTLSLAHYESKNFLSSIIDEEDSKICKVLKAGVHQKAGKKYCFFSKDGEFIYFKIKKINKSNYSGWVYNFECETHTFMCHHITTHNCDPYREDETASSSSLGYITVLRRMHSDITDPFRGKQVASFLGRKKTVKEFHQLLLDLAEWYGAFILYEHSDRALLDFFEERHKAYLLIDSVPIQKEIFMNTKTKNTKGLRPTKNNKSFLLSSTLGFVNEDVDEEALGYSNINDDVLLQQLEVFDPDENLDCYIGFSHAVAAYNYYEKMGVPVVENKEKNEKEKPIKAKVINAFGIDYSKKHKNAFGFR